MIAKLTKCRYRLEKLSDDNEEKFNALIKLLQTKDRAMMAASLTSALATGGLSLAPFVINVFVGKILQIIDKYGAERIAKWASDGNDDLRHSFEKTLHFLPSIYSGKLTRHITRKVNKQVFNVIAQKNNNTNDYNERANCLTMKRHGKGDKNKSYGGVVKPKTTKINRRRKLGVEVIK